MSESDSMKPAFKELVASRLTRRQYVCALKRSFFSNPSIHAFIHLKNQNLRVNKGEKYAQANFLNQKKNNTERIKSP